MKYILGIIGCICICLSGLGQARKVGDVIANRDGSVGVVFWVNSEGSEGWMVALHDLPLKYQWGKTGEDVPALENVGAASDINKYSKVFKGLSDNSGYANTLKLKNHQGTGNRYPAQSVELENGWYVPAAGQMRKLFTAMQHIRGIILARGGDDLKRERYWSSTEYDARNAWSLYCNPGELNFHSKDSILNVRPVRSFSVRETEYDKTLAYRWSTGEVTPFIKKAPGSTTEYEVEVQTTAGCINKASRQVLVASRNDTVIVASVCPGESYTQNGFNVSKTDTTYVRVLRNADGCEMKVTLKLYAREAVTTVIDAAICEGEIYQENNFAVWTTGRYVQNWTAASGCDSTVILNLTVHPVYRDTIRAVICEGETYTENGFDVSDAGFYNQWLHTVSGCDSVVTLDLGVRPLQRDTVVGVICEGDAYKENGFDVSTAGYHEQFLKNTFGCDSIVTLDLTVRPVYRDTIRAFICTGESYTDHGFNVAASGYYDLLLKSIDVCDSLVTLDLTVHPKYRDTIAVVLCEGETYTENGFVVSDPGYYNRNLKTVFGCDSIVTLYAEVLSVYRDTVLATICEGETYSGYGFQTAVAGYHEQILKSTGGCDSVITLCLTVNPTYRDTVQAAVCEGEVYTGYGFEQSLPGYYEREMQSISGCDSLLVLHLTVHPVYHCVLPAAICEGEIYTENGFSVSAEGTYDQMLHTIQGCDSLISLVLSVHPVYQDTVFAEICGGETYTENGFRVSEAGVYERNLQTQRACDSTVMLYLTVHPSYLFDSTVGICEGDRYVFRGKELSETGRYEELLTTDKGCDSLYRVDLTVHALYDEVIEALICEGEHYRENDFDVNEPGEYVRHLHSVYGCDSIVTLRLQTVDYFKGEIACSLEDCRLHSYFFSVEGGNVSTDFPEVYSWDLGDGTLSVLPELSHEYRDSGDYRVRLSVDRAGICKTSLEYSLSVPFFTEEFEIETSLKALDEDYRKVFFHTNCRPDMTYEWELGDGTTVADCEAVHKYELEDRKYIEVKLTVRNAEDCPVERSLRLPVYHSVAPPNTFSPNGDGVNDFFMSGYKLRIIDRNGVEIFKGEDGWDGTYKGKQVPEDTYFYELQYATARGNKTKKGYITVVR